MIYLLDVNALIALAHQAHAHHPEASAWLARLGAGDSWATSSITEIGFVRVSVQAGLQPSVSDAKAALKSLKASAPSSVALLADDLGAADLPAYVTKPAAVTDGHLLALAKRHGAKLATFDAGIPGAELIA